MATQYDVTPDDQQPIGRTVGSRRVRRLGDGLPSKAERDAMSALVANRRTRAPKGVFIYHSREEMEADRFKWQVDAMVEVARNMVKSK